MSLRTTISSAGWNTTGAANAASTGFNTLVGTSLTHGVGEPDNPDLAGKFVAGSVATTITIGIDASAAIFASGETEYRMEVVAALMQTEATIGSFTGELCDVNTGGGTRAYLRFLPVNTTPAAGAYITFHPGVSTGCTLDELDGQYRDAVVPVNQKVTIGVQISKTTGHVVGYVNGQAVATAKAASTPVAWPSSITLKLSGASGTQWRLYGNAKSYIGTDTPALPDWSGTAKSTDLTTKYLVDFDNVVVPGNSWTYTNTPNITNYAIGGVSPCRRRPIAGASGTTSTSTYDIGDLPYNWDGTATVDTLFYVPSGGSYSIALRDAANAVDLIKFVVTSGGALQDGSGNAILDGSGAAVTISNSARYVLGMHFARNGARAFTLLNQTATTGRRCWSGPLANWTSQTIGRAVRVGSNTVELDRVAAHRRWVLIGDSSIMTANTDALSPVLACCDNNTGSAFPQYGSMGVPGGGYLGKWFGWPRMVADVAIGRGGLKFSEVVTDVLAWATHTMGARLLFVDPFFNDLNGGAQTAAQCMTQLQAAYAWCTAHGSELAFSKTFVRNDTGAFKMSAAGRIQQRTLNDSMAAWVIANATSDRIRFADIDLLKGGLLGTADGAHPATRTADAYGAGRAVQSLMVSASQYAGLRKSTEYSAGRAVKLGSGEAAYSTGRASL